MSSEHPTPSSDLERENAELRRRLIVAETALGGMRVEALARRAEVRALAESLPTAMSRHALLRSMAHDARHHPDKAGVVKRAIAKAGRAPRKAVRLVRERT
jgi:hypothetical protein